MQDLFERRLEHEAKNRRRFWTLENNPETEAYFDPVNTDRAWAQQGWAKTHWFQISANSPAPYWQYVSSIIDNDSLCMTSELEINPIRTDGWMNGTHPSIRKIQIAPSGIRMNGLKSDGFLTL